VIEKPAMARRAGAGRDRRVEAVDVDGDVVIGPARNLSEDALHAETAELAHRHDARAEAPHRLIVAAVGGGDAADAELRHADDVPCLRGAAQRVAVAVADAVALIDEVEMGVDMDDVDGAAPFESLD